MPSFTRFKKRLRGNLEDTSVVICNSLYVEDAVVEDVDWEGAVVKDVVKEPEKTKFQVLSSKLKLAFGFKEKTLSVDEHAEQMKNMTKLELDQYAEQYDIYLDRRQTKTNMVAEFLTKLKEKN